MPADLVGEGLRPLPRADDDHAPQVVTALAQELEAGPHGETRSDQEGAAHDPEQEQGVVVDDHDPEHGLRHEQQEGEQGHRLEDVDHFPGEIAEPTRAVKAREVGDREPGHEQDHEDDEILDADPDGQDFRQPQVRVREQVGRHDGIEKGRKDEQAVENPRKVDRQTSSG